MLCKSLLIASAGGFLPIRMTPMLSLANRLLLWTYQGLLISEVQGVSIIFQFLREVDE